MQCFLIKFNGEYVRDVSTPFCPFRMWGNEYRTVDTTTEIDEAKHYKVKSSAKTWINNCIQSINNDISILNRRITDTQKQISNYNNNFPQSRHNSSPYWVNEINRYKLKITQANDCLALFQDTTKVYVEVEDIETPNFTKTVKARWRYPSSHSSNMACKNVNHSRYTCNSCGLVLKNIPFYTVNSCSSIKICIPCLYLRIANITSEYEKMDERVRQEITNEHILGGL